MIQPSIYRILINVFGFLHFDFLKCCKVFFAGWITVVSSTKFPELSPTIGIFRKISLQRRLREIIKNLNKSVDKPATKHIPSDSFSDASDLILWCFNQPTDRKTDSSRFA